MKLTPFAKLFITVVVLGVLGYAFWHYKGDTVRQWAGAEKGAAVTVESDNAEAVDKIAALIEQDLDA